MKEIIKSDTTGKTYHPSDVIRLLNFRQLMFYMNHGIEILDFYPSKDFKTGDDVLVFVVDKNKSKDVYREWMEGRNYD